MDRESILREIRRSTEANGGKPLGQRTFEKQTGITGSRWRNHWARWSDALREAGFSPNEPIQSYTEAFVAEHLVVLTRRLGRFPTWREWNIERRGNREFPGTSTVQRMGGIEAVRGAVLDYCRGRDDCEDVRTLLEATIARAPDTAADTDTRRGIVYLIKAGRQYKIGKTIDLEQRSRQFSIQLPHPHVIVHKLETDDAAGIEAYWHRRFDGKRLGTSEWFALTAVDVEAFRRRRKFM